jgi:hypothetical protein
MAEPGFSVVSSKDKLSAIKASNHGWAPETPEMHGIFIAAGPGIPKGKRIPAISVVDVYPLMLHQLGLAPNLAVDSDQQLWPGLLSYPPPSSHE